MAEAKIDIIREALNMLYDRIDSPLMRYKNTRDEALAALDEIEAGAEDTRETENDRQPVEKPESTPDLPPETENDAENENDTESEDEGSPLDDTTTIDEVKRLVEKGEVSEDEALEWEKVGKSRVTLIKWLEGRLGDGADE